MPSAGPETARPERSARLLLGLAAVAVMFAAADTYVVVLSLPDMMGSVGLSVDQLQRAAPIVSGFLLGYVAMLPLIGRIADLRGRTPVLVAALVVFAFGSLVTAAAYDLGSLVVGRFLQGVGGGGLVPVTLALVADLYPAERRGVPLGVVGAVQELGSVLGPLYGAVVLAFGTWRDIFWINLAVGLVLAAAIVTLGGSAKPDSPSVRPPPTGVSRVRSLGTIRSRRFDWIGLLLLALTLVSLLLVMRQPEVLVTSVDLGGPFVPFSDGGSIWASQIGVATGGARRAAAGAAADREATTGRPARLVGLGARGRPARRRPAVDRPRRDHPRLRHGRPRGAGVQPGRALVPRHRRCRRRAVRPAQPPFEGAAGAARRLRQAARLGRDRGQLLRRRGADRRAGGHPDLRADHRRRRLADQGRPGAGRVPGRAAGRSTAGRRTHPAAAVRGGRGRRDGARHGRVLADVRAGATTRCTTCRPRWCWRWPASASVWPSPR